jgi:MYXO-CTERM domain-containing protein
MMPSLRTIVVAGLCCLPGWGIVIQDVSAAGYVTSDSAYTGVVEVLSGGGSTCSGALISPYYVLTAGHCVNNQNTWSVRFQTPSTSLITSYGVAGAFLNPNFGASPYPGLYIWDTAILQLATPAPADATVYGIGSLSGITPGQTLLDLVGYGLGGGTTATGAATSVWGAGVRRHAVNWLTPDSDSPVDGLVYTSGGIITKMCTNPSTCYSIPDSPLGIELSLDEAPDGVGLINGGDSGGPLLYCTGGTCVILGVSDFGDVARAGTYSLTTDYSAGFQNLSEAENLQFIQSYVAPEPGIWLLGASGLAAIWVLRRRRLGNPL